MPKLSIKQGTTSFIGHVVVYDSTASYPKGLTGVAYNASGLKCLYMRPGASSDVSPTINSISTLGTFAGDATHAGWKEVDSTNWPGLYEINIPDNALASGAKQVVVTFRGAANMIDVELEIELVSYDPFDATHLGLSALPNASAASSGGLPTVGTGANQLDVDSSGRVNVGKWLGSNVAATNSGYPDVNAKYVAGTAQTARDLGASVLLSPGTGTGQVDLSSGQVKVQSGTSSGQLDVSSGQVKVQSGTGSGQLDVISGQVKVQSGTGSGQIQTTSGAVNLVPGQLTVKKNTALNGVTFLMTDLSGAPATGLSVSSNRTIDGGSVASTTNSVTELSNGIYRIDLSAADLNGNWITFLMTASGAAPCAFSVTTQA